MFTLTSAKILYKQPQFRWPVPVDDMDQHINATLQEELDVRIKEMFQVLEKMIDNMHQNYAEVLRQDLLTQRQHPGIREIVTELDHEYRYNLKFRRYVPVYQPYELMHDAIVKTSPLRRSTRRRKPYTTIGC